MTKLLPLALVLLAAPAAAQQGLWPVQAAGETCTMAQAFMDPEFGNTALRVGYDAASQKVTLTATSAVPDEFLGSDPGSDKVEWTIVFLDNGDEAYDDGWGRREFDLTREADAYRLSTAFAGEKNVRQILADLAASRSVGFMRGGKLVTAYDLAGAGPSISRLRDCATRVVAAN